ncbi:DUF2973 domain-containing protein [Stenomitos frigidus]|uniref:DUF2973 domain-containing protein n=1 Tax=Stenomitos frigidus ULC18 TaxID=2107698 RepID=A0A2T1DWC7_9CYAN|nr:DUF2973 domain-containing protein [Stenomitos frigidus]PSB24769.1 DUF2973 domain-containing protein [Stenomitos frigidus ULC18]
MLLHLLYIIAFTTLAFLAVGNLIRNLMTLGVESQRSQAPRNWAMGEPKSTSRLRMVPHPEFLDTAGNVINEPLLVMRSMSVEDAREQLDALYESSPGANASGSSDRREDV